MPLHARVLARLPRVLLVPASLCGGALGAGPARMPTVEPDQKVDL